jgi:hypothetical membrane protein
MPSSFALHPPHPTVRRYSNLARVVRPSAMAGAVILCTAILLAALGTVDPLWWHLHFSRLGTFADASGYTFNGGVILSGLVIAAGAVPLAVHLASAQAAGRITDARAARMMPPLLVTLGLCLALIGVIPLTLNEFLHDRAANGVLLSFLGLVIVSRRTLPQLPKFLGRYAICAVILLVVGMAVMISGIINLAAFEVLAFGSVLSWVHLLERSVRSLDVRLPAPAEEAPEAVADCRADSHGHVVRQDARSRVPATVAVRSIRPSTSDTGSFGIHAVEIRRIRTAHDHSERGASRASERDVMPGRRHAVRPPRCAQTGAVTGPRRSTGYTPRARRVPSPAYRG